MKGLNFYYYKLIRFKIFILSTKIVKKYGNYMIWYIEERI